jgi:hypothetical protein
MWNDREEGVGVPLDHEVEPVVVIHPCLPDTLGLVIFLGSEGGDGGDWRVEIPVACRTWLSFLLVEPNTVSGSGG